VYDNGLFHLYRQNRGLFVRLSAYSFYPVRPREAWARRRHVPSAKSLDDSRGGLWTLFCVRTSEFAVEMREAIQKALDDLPDERVREVLEFARFISQADEARDWRTFGESRFGRAYGNDEPDYSEADIKPGTAV
jgi:hypothetical protein